MEEREQSIFPDLISMDGASFNNGLLLSQDSPPPFHHGSYSPCDTIPASPQPIIKLNDNHNTNNIMNNIPIQQEPLPFSSHHQHIIPPPFSMTNTAQSYRYNSSNTERPFGYNNNHNYNNNQQYNHHRPPMSISYNYPQSTHYQSSIRGISTIDNSIHHLQLQPHQHKDFIPYQHSMNSVLFDEPPQQLRPPGIFIYFTNISYNLRRNGLY